MVNKWGWNSSSRGAMIIDIERVVFAFQIQLINTSVARPIPF